MVEKIRWSERSQSGCNNRKVVLLGVFAAVSRQENGSRFCWLGADCAAFSMSGEQLVKVKGKKEKKEKQQELQEDEIDELIVTAISQAADKELEKATNADDEAEFDDEGELDDEPVVWFQVFVKTLKGKTITLDVTMSDTVANLKGQIQCKEHIPPNKQRLCLRGKDLDDSETLLEAGMLHESESHVLLRVRGGSKRARVAGGGGGDAQQDVDKESVKPAFATSTS